MPSIDAVPTLLEDVLAGLPVQVGDHAACFRLGQQVCLIKPGPGRSPSGTVTSILVSPSGFAYGVTWADTRRQTRHFDMELIELDEDEDD